MNRQNDDFELKHSPEETYAGDANKIKLKVASYTTILEVERAYLEEEKNKAAIELSEATVKANDENSSLEDKKKVEELSRKYQDINSTLERFMEKREKFLDIAKKALRLPQSNLDELEKNGKTVFDGETIVRDDLESKLDVSFEEAQKPLVDEKSNELVFNSIDPEVIREEVEKAIYSNEKDDEGLTDADRIDENLTDKNLEKMAKYGAEAIKEELDQPISEATLNSLFDAEGTVEPEFTPDTSKEQETEVKPIEVRDDYFTHLGEQNTKPSPSFEGFDNDKDMEAFIASLNAEKDKSKARLQDSKNRNVELNNTKKGLDEELGKADTSLEEAKRRKKLAETRKKYFEAIMPEVKELKAQEEEQNKKNALVEQEIAERQERLDSTNSQIDNYNNEAEALEKEVEEMIKSMRNSDDDYGQMGGSGRTK